MESLPAFKLVLLGDTAVGKTSLIRALTSGGARAAADPPPTMGSAPYKVVRSLASGQSVTLQVWDTNGQRTYISLTQEVYQDADMVLIVYDKTDQYTFDSVDLWLRAVRDVASPKVMVVLLGNKQDLEYDEIVNRATGLRHAHEHSMDFYEVSAMWVERVAEVFLQLASKLVAARALPLAPEPVPTAEPVPLPLPAPDEPVSVLATQVDSLGLSHEQLGPSEDSSDPLCSCCHLL